VAVLYAVVNGLLDRVPVHAVRDFERALRENLRSQENELMARIADTGLLTDEDAALLDKAICTFADAFLSDGQ